MGALTIKQPWATLTVMGAKPVENRSWPTRHRGKLLIHAGRKIDHDAIDRLRRIVPSGRLLLDMPVGPDEFPRGGIIGQVDVIDCVQDSDSPWAIPDHWHWELANPRPLPFTPMPGRLGLFHVGDDDQLQLDLAA